jgi:hypothetical protein
MAIGTSRSSPTVSNDTSKWGYVYILTSPNSECIKIGGTDFPPLKRIREINTSPPYEALGPWTLSDFRQVTDWRKVEHSLHYTFRSAANRAVLKQRELFNLPPKRASDALSKIDGVLIVRKPRVDRMFQDQEFLDYLLGLFRFSGILTWLNMQGAWTFTLYPSTMGGRYFTLNIGRHEVAFSTLPRADQSPVHYLMVDRLIEDLPAVRRWLGRRGGRIERNQYASALPRLASVRFEGDFEAANEFMRLQGVRRALIAYWSDALLSLKDSGASSVFARFHDWNAVAQLNKKIVSS